MQQSKENRRIWSSQSALGAWWLWVISSVTSMLLGARIALWQFPIAPYTLGDFTQYSDTVIKFVLLWSVPFPVLQGLLLYLYFKPKRGRALRTLLWVPTTYAGVVAMLLSIWTIKYPLAAWMLFIVMFPGAIAMGALQWVSSLREYSISKKWILWSALTPLLGEITFFSSIWFLPEGHRQSHEAILFAGCLGLAFGIWQATIFVHHFSPNKTDRRSIVSRDSLRRWS